MAIYNKIAANLFLPVQGVTSQPFGAWASNFLSITQNVTSSPWFLFVKQNFRITQSTLSNPNILHQTATNRFNINQDLRKVIPQSVSQIFLMGGFARLIAGYQNFAQVLGFSQTVTAVNAKPSYGVLSFTQVAGYKLSTSSVVNQTFAMISSATAYLRDKNFVSITIVQPVPTGGGDGRCPEN